jgi:hypothetical protein
MWQISFTSSAGKAYNKLNAKIQSIIDLLVIELEVSGPIRGNWKNYSKLSKTEHHCHIKTGKPTFVACWREKSKEELEIYYVGTHEKAPY